MRRNYRLLWTALLLAVLCCGCAGRTEPVDMKEGGRAHFQAVVLELLDDGVVVEPLAGERLRDTADRVAFRTGGLAPLVVEIGDTVVVWYEGAVRETYPAGVDAVEWEISEKGVALG